MAYNKVILCGRVASDLELKQTQSGKSVISFSVAIRRDNENTDFFTVSAWNKNAEFICRYFHKGDGIGIEGKLTSRKYEKDGVKHTVYEILCDGAFFAESAKKDDGGANTPANAYNPYTSPYAPPAASVEAPDDGNLPF